MLRWHPKLDCDITLMGRVVWTGRSSMVINMRQETYAFSMVKSMIRVHLHTIPFAPSLPPK